MSLRAYSQDLIKTRMVHQVEMQGKSCREVGDNLNVNASTVQNCCSFFNNSETVDKRKHPPNSGTAVLTDIY